MAPVSVQVQRQRNRSFRLLVRRLLSPRLSLTFWKRIMCTTSSSSVSSPKRRSRSSSSSPRRIWHLPLKKKLRNGSSSSSSLKSTVIDPSISGGSSSSSSKRKPQLQRSSTSPLLLSRRDRDPNRFENEADTSGLDSDLSDPNSCYGEDERPSWNFSDSDSSDGESKSAPSYDDYALEDKAHLGSTKWPCEANCKSFDEYFLQYLDVVTKSEGFTSFVDPTSYIEGGITPCPLNEYVQEASKFAVGEHNSKKGANIMLKRIMKANRQIQKGSVYYLTLEAAEEDKVVYYEAKVRSKLKRGVYELEIFRPAKHYIPSH